MAPDKSRGKEEGHPYNGPVYGAWDKAPFQNGVMSPKDAETRDVVKLN